jgi:hypothetical protein
MHKKFLFLGLLSTVFFILLSSSCSLDKRTYNRGYSINYKSFNLKSNEDKTSRNIKTYGKEDKKQLIASDIGQNISSLINDKELGLKVVNDSNTIPLKCDWILYKDGTEIEANVIEISDDFVKFKKCDYLDGPTYTKKISDIFMIKYRNGKKEIFNRAPEAQAPIVTNNPSSSSVNNNLPPTENQSAEEDSGGYSILSFVLSIVSLIIPFGAILFALAGLVFGFIGLNNGLKGLAVAGIIISFITIVIILSIL